MNNGTNKPAEELKEKELESIVGGVAGRAKGLIAATVATKGLKMKATIIELQNAEAVGA